MFSPDCILVKTASEISLKTNFVRSYLMHKLRESIKFSMKRNFGKIKKMVSAGGRLYIYTDDFEKAEEILKTTFGVHSFTRAKHYKFKNLETFSDKVLEELEDFFDENDTFAVRAKAIDTKKLKSKDVEIFLGAEINKKFSGKNLKVNLGNPKKTVFVEVRNGESHTYFNELEGPKGLPLGSQGNVAMFFKGRKEELAAALLMMKRGCNIFPVVQIATPSLVSHLEPLVKWNAYRRFTITETSNSKNLIKARNIEAIVLADAFLGEKHFDSYGEADKKLELLVFRPLLLYPEELLEEKYDMLGGKK